MTRRARRWEICCCGWVAWPELGGVVLCAAAFAGRLSGTWFLGNFQIGTILLAGIAGMVLGCLAYCASLAERPRC